MYLGTGKPCLSGELFNMIKILLSVLLLIGSLSALELDVKTLQEIAEKDPTALKEKILLAKYYEKNENNLKALALIEEVLEQDSANVNARAIKAKIETKERVKGLFREAGLSLPIVAAEAQKRLDSYYETHNYQFYSNLYQALVDTDVTLEDPYHIKAAHIYLRDARYKESQKALNHLQQNKNIDAEKIRADICYYTGKYNCALKRYEKLYKASYSTDIAVKLINTYIYTGQITKAERLYNFVDRKHPNNSELQKLGSKIAASKNSHLMTMQKAYEKDKNSDTLTAYADALFSAGKKDETVALIHKYNSKNTTNKTLILEAKYLIWMGKTESALKILKHSSLNNDLSARLMLGQIYSWNHNFGISKKNLNEVIAKTKDKALLFDAKKALAFVYMWEKKADQSKKLFKALQKQRPADQEVKEALMELNHDYERLITIYRAKSNSSAGKKRLAELYTLNKQPKMAIKYLKEYVNENPADMKSTKALALLLVDNKEYYQGFGYLEYYAVQKQTAEASILLAQNYYWHGFSKEALDVLNRLLIRESKNKAALQLKAKILKVAPRFTTNNSGTTAKMYFENLAKKQLFLADTLYFNGHYIAALEYYQNYLRSNPDDHDVRYRYAFALENAKEYGKAEGEFSLMFLTQDSDELRYHYAYNMMKNGKLQESKKLLLELKGRIYQKLDSNLSKFLTSWKSSWESLDFKAYSSHYDNKFLRDGTWALKKHEKFSTLSYISVGIHDPLYKKIAKNSYKIKFYQEYKTDKNADKGYKTLYIKCASGRTECRITKEEWKKGEQKKELLLMPYIDKSLQENKRLKAKPFAFNSKKKILLLKKLNLKSSMIYT